MTSTVTVEPRYWMDSDTYGRLVSWSLRFAPCADEADAQFTVCEAIRGFLEDRDASDADHLLERRTWTELYDLATRDQ